MYINEAYFAHLKQARDLFSYALSFPQSASQKVIFNDYPL